MGESGSNTGVNKGFSSGNISESESNGGVTINNNYSSNVIAIINDPMNTTTKSITSNKYVNPSSR